MLSPPIRWTLRTKWGSFSSTWRGNSVSTPGFRLQPISVFRSFRRKMMSTRSRGWVLPFSSSFCFRLCVCLLVWLPFPSARKRAYVFLCTYMYVYECVAFLFLFLLVLCTEKNIDLGPIVNDPHKDEKYMTEFFHWPHYREKRNRISKKYRYISYIDGHVFCAVRKETRFPNSIGQYFGHRFDTNKLFWFPVMKICIPACFAYIHMYFLTDISISIIYIRRSVAVTCTQNVIQWLTFLQTLSL